MPDFSNFIKVQTATAWGKTLGDFATFCRPAGGTRILDVGCGPALLPAIFAERGCNATGVDLDYKLLKAGIFGQVAQADARRLPFPAGSFDMVTATNVLFLMDQPVEVLAGWARLLRKEGEICLLNPSEQLSARAAERVADERGLDETSRESLMQWARNAESHFRWNEAETSKILKKAGLALIETRLRVRPGFARFSRAKRAG